MISLNFYRYHAIQHDHAYMQAFGILSSIVFIVPAIVSAFIRSKITNRSRRETSQPTPDPAAGTTTDTESAPATSMMIQLPSSAPQALNDAGSSSDPPPAYYTTVAGEGGDFSQNAHSYPTAPAGVEQPYYSQAQPGLGGPIATVNGDGSPQNAYDYPAVSVAGGGGVDADDSFYSRALRVEPGITVAVDGTNETGRNEPPSYVSIMA